MTGDPIHGIGVPDGVVVVAAFNSGSQDFVLGLDVVEDPFDVRSPHVPTEQGRNVSRQDVGERRVVVDVMRDTLWAMQMQHPAGEAVKRADFRKLAEVSLQIVGEVVDERQDKLGLWARFKQLSEAERLAGARASNNDLEVRIGVKKSSEAAFPLRFQVLVCGNGGIFASEWDAAHGRWA